MSRQLPECDHDDCPPTGCKQRPKLQTEGSLAAPSGSGAPPSIVYLQWDGDADEPNRELPYEKRGEISWCQDKIFKLDVEYIQRDELRAWLKNEILEDEGAMINARDHGEWDRYHRLDGHKGALVHVLHHLRAMRQNDKVSDGR